MPTLATTDIVLSAFQTEQEYGAFDLLKFLKEKGMSESEIKEAIAYLINEHQIELTPERRLRSVQAEAHA